MTRRLLLGSLSIAAFALVILVVPLGVTTARQERERLLGAAERDAVVIAQLVEDDLQFATPTALNPPLGDYTQRTGARVVVTNRDGLGVFDSDPPAGGMRDFSTRPEIAEALDGRRAAGVRFSETLGRNQLVIAVPVASGGGVHGVVRITLPASDLEARIGQRWLLLGIISLVVLAATALVGLVVASWVTRPLAQTGHAVQDIAGGDLSARAPTDRGPPEVRDLAQRVNTMADRLSESIASQQAFVADASHQLRSPLTALRLELENLEPEADGEVRAGLERAGDEAARLARIVDGLLLLARADGARPEPAVVDAAAVARERHELWSTLAEEREVNLELEAPQHAPAQSVPGHLDQILDNLVANALEVAPAGTAVSLEVASFDGLVHVAVKDEGPGMSAEQRAHAFDRFWRAPGAAHRGSGLGLPIARQLARAGGGDVRLERAAGGGLLAVVELPAAAR